MTPDSLYNPFATPASGRDAIREALTAIDQMERDARERREKREQAKPRPAK